MNRTARTHLAFALGLLSVLGVAAVAPTLLFRSRLPDPLATHWGPSGRPDDETGVTGFTVGLAVVLVVLSVVAVAAALHKPHREPVGLAGTLTFMGALATAVSWFTVWANLDRAGWMLARSTPWPAMAAVVGFPVALAFVAHRAEARWWPSAGRWRHPEETPTLGLAPGERASWTGTCTSRWAAPMAIGAGALGAAAAMTQVRPVAAVLLFVAAASTPYTSIRVTCGPAGMRLAYGWLGWPRKHIPLSRIRQASVIDLKPMEWGGYGYRGSRLVMRRAAVLLRSGGGIRLDLADGTVLAITVDDAATGAAVINDLRRIHS